MPDEGRSLSSTEEAAMSGDSHLTLSDGRQLRLVPCRCVFCRKGLSRHKRVPMGHRDDGWEGHRPRISDADLAEWRATL